MYSNKFKKGGVVKTTRLAIGETQITKPLPVSKPHCQMSNVPPEVFKEIVSFVEK